MEIDQKYSNQMLNNNNKIKINDDLCALNTQLWKFNIVYRFGNNVDSNLLINICKYRL